MALRFVQARTAIAMPESVGSDWHCVHVVGERSMSDQPPNAEESRRHCAMLSSDQRVTVNSLARLNHYLAQDWLQDCAHTGIFRSGLYVHLSRPMSPVSIFVIASTHLRFHAICRRHDPTIPSSPALVVPSECSRSVRESEDMCRQCHVRS
ncbi:hypothetical protein E4U56_006898 [Claviceps arundinis]|uniref:Uncharacterized protein n=1 Tax=Claviceps arundinis TaxID=1623583 RepID=A0A9P7SU62_9HYPO|nr:hypothetical protein E4U56_006898 [Claviceps arundinis]